MLLEMFVNELSLTPARDVATAHVWAKGFVETMRAAASRGVYRGIYVPEDFSGKPLATGYYWRDWLADRRVDVELRRYYRSLTTKSPFLRDQPALEKVFAGIDCFVGSAAALGVRAAYVADGLAVSLLSDATWDRPLLACEIHEIVDEDIISRCESVHHASTSDHVLAQSEWIHGRIQSTVLTGQELWRRVDELFPRLEFCVVVEDQMVRLPSLSLASVVRGLFRLNAFCLSWQSGTFDPHAIECTVSPEKESTLQQFGNERTFMCPDGEYRVFSWHVKLGQWRIYFAPCVGTGRLLIGYVGDHLRTVKFR
jgi:hypothetical protein